MGYMTPPAPILMVEVALARWAISTAGAELAMADMLADTRDPESVEPESLHDPRHFSGLFERLGRC